MSDNNNNSFSQLCQAIKKDLSNEKKFLKVIPLFLVATLILLFLALHSFGLRHDLHTKLNEWQTILTLVALAFMFLSCFGVSKYIKSIKTWLFSSAIFLLFLAFWEPLCNTMLGIKFAGWGNFFNWNPVEFTCTLRGLSIGLIMLTGLNLTQYKMNFLPNAQTYFITGTISAVSGIMLQNLMCYADVISHLSIYHLTQAIMIFGLNFGVQKFLELNWNRRLKTKLSA